MPSPWSDPKAMREFANSSLREAMSHLNAVTDQDAVSGECTDDADKMWAGLTNAEDQIEHARRYYVHALRLDGWTWDRIGATFGVTRQAAQQRWGALDTTR